MNSEPPAPPSVQTLWLQGQALLRSGRHQEALAPLVAASQRAPGSAAIWNDLGTACRLGGRSKEAIACLTRALGLDPAAPRAHFNLGLALAQAGDLDGALAEYRKAAELEPGLAVAHALAADILMRQGRRDEAAGSYARAFAASPDTEVGRLCRAKELAAEGRSAEAEAHLRPILAVSPSHAEAVLVLGHVLAEAGRFDDAAACFERSLALAPDHAASYYALVSIRRVPEPARGLLARIEARLDREGLTDRGRMLLSFAAGKARDDLGEYGEAMAHFDAANRVRRALAPFDSGALERQVSLIVGRPGAPQVGGPEPTFEEDTPVLVFGMPRSGTTLVDRILSSHPLVASAGETSFWPDAGQRWTDAGGAWSAAVRDEARRGYVDRLRRADATGRHVVDKTPFNFFWLGLVAEAFPRARLVHCRRDPRDTCLSIYSTYFRKLWGFAGDRSSLATYYRAYERLVGHWRSVLPPGRILDVDYEALTAAQEPETRRLLAFCGLPWHPACLAPERNPRAVTTASKWQVRQPVYRTSVARWRRYEAWLGEIATLPSPRP